MPRKKYVFLLEMLAFILVNFAGIQEKRLALYFIKIARVFPLVLAVIVGRE